jgi:flagellar FliL protein
MSASEQDAKPEGEGGEKKAAAPKTGMIIGLALAGAALGGGVGSFVLAPKLAAKMIPAAAVAKAGAERADSAADSTADGEEKGKDGKEAAGKIFKLENLIVNPAGSEGTRFLMTTVAFETQGEELDAKLREHEIEVRDRVITILEGKSLEALTQAGARDSLKRELGAAVTPVLGPKARFKVFLPQFVIQ